MTTHVLPITDFRKEAKGALDKIKEAPIVLTQRSRPVAVLVDYDAYRSQEQRLEALELMLDDQLLANALATASEFVTLDEVFG